MIPPTGPLMSSPMPTFRSGVEHVPCVVDADVVLLVWTTTRIGLPVQPQRGYRPRHLGLRARLDGDPAAGSSSSHDVDGRHFDGAFGVGADCESDDVPRFEGHLNDIFSGTWGCGRWTAVEEPSPLTVTAMFTSWWRSNPTLDGCSCVGDARMVGAVGGDLDFDWEGTTGGHEGRALGGGGLVGEVPGRFVSDSSAASLRLASTAL